MRNEKNPKIAVLGGDARSPEAARRLVELGAEVALVGSIPSHSCPGICSNTDPAEALQNASAVLLPVQGVSEEGLVFSGRSQPIRLGDEALTRVNPEACLFVGKASSFLRTLAERHRLRICEYYDCDDFAILNSIPSAEGAVLMAMQDTPFTIFGSEALVLGFGRTGGTLSRILKVMGSRVAVAARKPADLARIASEGMRPVEYHDLSRILCGVDLIFNTVPTLILPETLLRQCRPDTVIIDLASAPGGIDFEAAGRLGIRAVLAPGLPGRVAPRSAGRYLAHFVVRHLKNTGHPIGEELADPGGWL